MTAISTCPGFLVFKADREITHFRKMVDYCQLHMCSSVGAGGVACSKATADSLGAEAKNTKNLPLNQK